MSGRQPRGLYPDRFTATALLRQFLGTFSIESAVFILLIFNEINSITAVSALFFYKSSKEKNKSNIFALLISCLVAFCT